MSRRSPRKAGPVPPTLDPSLVFATVAAGVGPRSPAFKKRSYNGLRKLFVCGCDNALYDPNEVSVEPSRCQRDKNRRPASWSAGLMELSDLSIAMCSPSPVKL